MAPVARLRRPLAAGFTAAALVLCLSGCGTGGDGADQSPTDPSESSSDVSPSDPPPPPRTPEVEKAVADLAARESVAVEDIEVVSLEAVTWRNGSLGCARPGTSYTQALVEGSRIVLSSGGTEFEYHSGGGQEPFYCATPSQ